MPKKNYPYNDRNGYAYIYVNRKPVALKAPDGSRCKTGSPEAKAAYHRYHYDRSRNPTGYIPPSGEQDTTVNELVAGFLNYSERIHKTANYTHYRIAMTDFLSPLYGDTAVAKFGTKCLKTVRDMMVQSERLNRKTINDYVRRIVTMFRWGVEEELVHEGTWGALKAVKSLPAGYPGTFEGDRVDYVPDWVVTATLPFMVPVLQAMVQIQGMLAMRPEEVCKMTVGSIDRSREKETGLWYYTPAHHKTEAHIGKKVLPLGKPEQKLIAPYLEGKSPDNAVFSPIQAMKERNAEKRAKRKSKVTPSQEARGKSAGSIAKHEFYTKDSYHKAVQYAIKKGRKAGVEIPHWFPKLLRNFGATLIEESDGIEVARAQTGHTTIDMTRQYAKGDLKKRETLAKKRVNPFAKAEE